MGRTPVEAATDTLVVAWERYDAECLRRSDLRRSNGTANPNSFLPQTATATKMQEAVAAFGALMGVESLAMRRLLTDSMKDGTSYRGAVALAVETLEAAADAR